MNLTGPFHTTRFALPHLLKPPVGAVVNIASTAGIRGTAYAAAYAASKAGLVNFTKTLALEFASRDLRFNCICPGGVRTPLIAKMFVRRDDLEQNLINYSAPPKIGNLADPIDIARLIAFLASDDARMVNGVALLADGGRPTTMPLDAFARHVGGARGDNAPSLRRLRVTGSNAGRRPSLRRPRVPFRSAGNGIRVAAIRRPTEALVIPIW